MLLSVRDEGADFPMSFHPHEAKSLGMRIIAAFSLQLTGSSMSIGLTWLGVCRDDSDHGRAGIHTARKDLVQN